jgi:hypothetical protein
MFKITLGILLLLVTTVVFGNCQAKKPEPMGHIPSGTGKPVIDLKGIIYPGSTPFQGAQYDYVSSDAPDKVAEWFRQSVQGSTVDKPTDAAPDAIWVVNYKDYIIEIIAGPNQTDTLVRYKKNLNTKSK